MGLAFVTLFGVARADNVGEARAHHERGMSAYALEHFAEAAEEYEKAFQLKADAALLYNAAQAHRLAGNSDRALRLYQSYLRVFGRKASNREEVERHIAALQRAIAVQQAAQLSPPVGVAEPEGPRPVNLVPTAPPPSMDKHPSIIVSLPARKPLYQKAWFWGVIAGVAVGIGVGVGVGVGTTGTKNPTPSFGTTTVN